MKSSSFLLFLFGTAFLLQGCKLWSSSSQVFSPRIDTASPTFSVGAGGGVLTLTGNFFYSGNEVTVGSSPCAIVSENLNTITCTIPANPAGATDISAQTVRVISGDQVSNGDQRLTFLGDVGLWYDADDESSLTISSTSVTQWADKSGHSRHASGGIAPNRVLDNHSGKYFVSFDGTTQWLDTPATWSDLTGNLSSATIIAVIHPKNLGPNPSGGFSYRADGIVGDSNGFFGLYLTDVGASPGIDGTVSKITPVKSVNINETTIAITTLDSTGLSISGADLNATTTTPGTIRSAGGSSIVRLGKSYNTFNQYFDGSIAEVLIFNRKLSETELTSIVTRLKSKWGL